MPKIKYLDGLRGVAALMVVFNHFFTAFYPALYFGLATPENLKNPFQIFIAGSVFNIFYNGNFAVCIFFVLSGYVLSRKFFHEKKSNIAISGAIKRYPRLLVPVLSSLLLVFIFASFNWFSNQAVGPISGSRWFENLFSSSPDFLKIIKQAFVGSLFQHQSSYNIVLWTMTYEFFGSMMVFGFIGFFGQTKKRYPLYLLFSLILFRSYYWAFLLGIMLSDLEANYKYHLEKIKNKKIIIYSLIILGIFLGSYPSQIPIDGTSYAFLRIIETKELFIILHTIGALMIMLALLSSEKIQKVLENKYFYFLGKISFSMYLIHLIIICSFSSYLFLQLKNFLPYDFSFLVTFILSMIVIFITSSLFYRLVDRKSIKFSHFLSDKIMGVVSKNKSQ
ncbi:MAG: acyltransferase [Candidatus Falkowbacteria bacterium]|nr:acyltransferase [Candidatus Falkowbacteria bacterium]